MKAWMVVAAIAAAAGIGAGYLAAAPTRGHGRALPGVTVSADGRSIAASGGPGDVLTAEETATTVRLQLRTGFAWLPIAGTGIIAVAHLRAPLGARRLIDATRPDHTAVVRLPTYLPAGFAPVGTRVDFDRDRCELIFATPGGVVLTVVEEPVTAGDLPPGAWRVIRDGRTYTVVPRSYGYDRIDPADPARVGASIGS